MRKISRPLCGSANGTWEQVQDDEGNWYCPPDPYVDVQDEVSE